MFYCSVDAPLNCYLGLIPIKEKGLTFPLDKWKGWYFSEQLKFAKDNGYKIKVFRGYRFSRENNVFTVYINKLYSINIMLITLVKKLWQKKVYLITY